MYLGQSRRENALTDMTLSFLGALPGGRSTFTV
jgi:hypothetical protein